MPKRLLGMVRKECMVKLEFWDTEPNTLFPYDSVHPMSFISLVTSQRAHL